MPSKVPEFLDGEDLHKLMKLPTNKVVEIIKLPPGTANFSAVRCNEHVASCCIMLLGVLGMAMAGAWGIPWTLQ